MKLRVGYELQYEFPQPTPLIAMLNIHFSRVADLADKEWHVVERSYGAFHRAIALPFEPNGASIEAHFDKGVLHLLVEMPDGVGLQDGAIAFVCVDWRHMAELFSLGRVIMA